MENQKEVWDKIAPSWNENRKRISPTVEGFLKEERGRILDLGCGSGRNFLKMDGQEVYATDFSEEMIKIARENANEKGMEVKLSVMDGERLDFEENYFDAVLCWAVLHCVHGREDRTKVLREVNRVMKPEGRMLISVWGKNSRRLKNKKKDDMVPWSKGLDDRVFRFNHTYELEEFKKDLEESGFIIEKLWEERNVNAIVLKSSQSA